MLLGKRNRLIKTLLILILIVYGIHVINQVLSFHLVVNSVIYFSNDDNNDKPSGSKLGQQSSSLVQNEQSPVKEETSRTSTTTKEPLNGITCPKREHIMFLKTHKCASSSIQNLFLRFGDSRDLFFALPKTDNYLGHPARFSRRFVLDPFMLKTRYNLSYSIVAHHLRFNYKELVSILPDDTIFITILRDPVKLFESLFVYYDIAYNALHRNLTLDQFAQLFQDDKRFAVEDDEEKSTEFSETNAQRQQELKKELEVGQEVAESENDAAEKVDDDRLTTRLPSATSPTKTPSNVEKKKKKVVNSNDKENNDGDVDRFDDRDQSELLPTNSVGVVSQSDNAPLHRQPLQSKKQSLSSSDVISEKTGNDHDDTSDTFNHRLYVRNGINYHMTSLTLKKPVKMNNGDKSEQSSPKSSSSPSWTWTNVLSTLISGSKNQPREEDTTKGSNDYVGEKAVTETTQSSQTRQMLSNTDYGKRTEAKKSHDKNQKNPSVDANFRVRGRYGRNQMAFDLGFNQRFFDTPRIISNFIDAIDSMFHLVLITERFEESLILLKHLLCWSDNDIITFQHNMRAEEFSKNFISSKSKKIIKKLNLADQMIYDHFYSKFDKIVNSFGKERMRQEVNQLKNLTEKLYQECVEAVVPMHDVLPKIYWPNSKVMAMKSKDFTLEEENNKKILQRKREQLTSVDHHDHEDNNDVFPEEDVVNNDVDDEDIYDQILDSTSNPLVAAKEKSILCQQLTLPEIVYTDNLKRKQQIMLRNRKLGLSSMNPIHHLMMKPEAAAAAAFDHNHRYLQVSQQLFKSLRKRSQKTAASSLLSEKDHPRHVKDRIML